MGKNQRRNLTLRSSKKIKMEEKFDPLDCGSQQQMEFLSWLSEDYPDFWEKIVKEYNEMLEETE